MLCFSTCFCPWSDSMQNSSHLFIKATKLPGNLRVNPHVTTESAEKTRLSASLNKQTQQRQPPLSNAAHHTQKMTQNDESYVIIDSQTITWFGYYATPTSIRSRIKQCCLCSCCITALEDLCVLDCICGKKEPLKYLSTINVIHHLILIIYEIVWIIQWWSQFLKRDDLLYIKLNSAFGHCKGKLHILLKLCGSSVLYH